MEAVASDVEAGWAVVPAKGAAVKRPQQPHEGSEEDEAHWARSTRFRHFGDALAHAMAAFDKSKDWPDLIKVLQRLHQVITKYDGVPLIPLRVTLSKRLAQCLNPALPDGVHHRALGLYSTIFDRIGPIRLARDLPLYTLGLFSLFKVASMKVKPVILALLNDHFLPLGPDLHPCMSGLVLTVLAGLEESDSDLGVTSMTLLCDIRDRVDPGVFYHSVWNALLVSAEMRGPAITFLSKQLPKAELVTEEMHLANNANLALRALCAGVSDSNVFVQRAALDLLCDQFPTGSSILSSQNTVPLMCAALECLLRREVSLTRRVFAWLLGTSQKQSSAAVLAMSASTTTPPSSFTLDDTLSTSMDGTVPDMSHYEQYSHQLVVAALCHMLTRPCNSARSAVSPFSILEPLLERPEVGDRLLLDVLPHILHAVATYKEGYAFSTDFVHAVTDFVELVDPCVLWIHLIDSVPCPLPPSFLERLQAFVDILPLNNLPVQTLLLPSLLNAVLHQVWLTMQHSLDDGTAALLFVLKMSGKLRHDCITLFNVADLQAMYGTSNVDTILGSVEVHRASAHVTPTVPSSVSSKGKGDSLGVAPHAGWGPAHAMVAAVQRIYVSFVTTLFLPLIAQGDADDVQDATPSLVAHDDGDDGNDGSARDTMHGSQQHTALEACLDAVSRLLCSASTHFLVPLSLAHDRGVDEEPDWCSSTCPILALNEPAFCLIGAHTLLHMVDQASKHVGPAAGTGGEAFVALGSLSPDQVSLILNERPYMAQLCMRCWATLVPEQAPLHYQVAQLWLRTAAVSDEPGHFLRSTLSVRGLPAEERVATHEKFALLWRLTGEQGVSYKPFEQALFFMLDSLTDAHPNVRLAGRSWLADSIHRVERIIDPLMDVLLHPTSARLHDVYQEEYDTRRVLYVFNTLTTIIECDVRLFMSHVMSRNVSAAVMQAHRDAVLPDPEMPPDSGHDDDDEAIPVANYVDLLVVTSLRYINGEAPESGATAFHEANSIVRNTAAEFLHFFLLKISPTWRACTLAAAIQESVLQVLAKAISQNRLVTQVQLLQLLRAIIVLEAQRRHEMPIAAMMHTPPPITSMPMFLQTILIGLLQPSSQNIRFHWLDFLTSSLPLLSDQLCQVVEPLVRCLCSIVCTHDSLYDSVSAKDVIVLLKALHLLLHACVRTTTTTEATTPAPLRSTEHKVTAWLGAPLAFVGNLVKDVFVPKGRRSRRTLPGSSRRTGDAPSRKGSLDDPAGEGMDSGPIDGDDDPSSVAPLAPSNPPMESSAYAAVDALDRGPSCADVGATMEVALRGVLAEVWTSLVHAWGPPRVASLPSRAQKALTIVTRAQHRPSSSRYGTKSLPGSSASSSHPSSTLAPEGSDGGGSGGSARFSSFTALRRPSHVSSGGRRPTAGSSWEDLPTVVSPSLTLVAEPTEPDEIRNRYTMQDHVLTVLEPLLETCASDTLAALLTLWKPSITDEVPCHVFQGVVMEMVNTLDNVDHHHILGAMCDVLRMLYEPEREDRGKGHGTVGQRAFQELTAIDFVHTYVTRTTASSRFASSWPSFCELAKLVLTGSKDPLAPVAMLRILEFYITAGGKALLRLYRTEVQGITIQYLLHVSCIASGASLDAGTLWPLCKGISMSLALHYTMDPVPPSPARGSKDSEKELAQEVCAHVALMALNALRVGLPSLVPVIVDHRQGASTINNVLGEVIHYVKQKTQQNQRQGRAVIEIISRMTEEPQVYEAAGWRKEALGVFYGDDFFMIEPMAVPTWRRVVNVLMTSPGAWADQMKALKGALTPHGPGSLFTSKEKENSNRARAIKRLAFTIFSGDMDQYLTKLHAVQAAIVEALKVSNAPNVLEAVFLCMRVLLCCVSVMDSLRAFWPVILTTLVRIFADHESDELPPSVMLSACKFLDMALTFRVEEFNLQHWIFFVSNPHVKAYYAQLSPLYVPFMERLSPLSVSTDASIRQQAEEPLTPSSGANLRRPFITTNSVMGEKQLQELLARFSEHVYTHGMVGTECDIAFITRLLEADFTDLQYASFERYEHLRYGVGQGAAERTHGSLLTRFFQFVDSIGGLGNDVDT